MHIEILHAPGCPNLDLARSRLFTALDCSGLTASVTEVEIADPAAAAERGMRGSPTITIDGTDPFEPATTAASLSCRLYWSEGRPDGSPDVARLAEAIARAE
jgi:hypothetical protein